MTPDVGVPRKDTLHTINIVEAMRGLDPNLPMQTMLCFLHIMDCPGIPQSVLQKRCGFSLASISRNVAYLSEWHRLRRPGLGLVVSREDPYDRRVKRIYLTKKGKSFTNTLAALMEKGKKK